MDAERLKFNKHQSYLRNKEKQRQARIDKRKNPDVLLEVNIKLKLWRANNPDKVKSYSSKSVEYKREWRNRNKHKPEYKIKNISYANTRRNLILNNTKQKLKPEDIKFIFERDNYSCLRCGNSDDLHLDHIVPLSKGGLNAVENLQVLCRSCNCMKFTKTVDYRKVNET